MSYSSQRERQAFQIIYENFYSQVFYIALAILKDHVLAEDELSWGLFYG